MKRTTYTLLYNELSRKEDNNLKHDYGYWYTRNCKKTWYKHLVKIRPKSIGMNIILYTQ